MANNAVFIVPETEFKDLPDPQNQMPEELTEATVRTLRMCEEFRKLSELTGTRPCTCCFQDQPSRYPIKDHQPLCRKRRHALQLLEMATARVLLVERADRASMAGYQEEGTVPR